MRPNLFAAKLTQLSHLLSFPELVPFEIEASVLQCLHSSPGWEYSAWAECTVPARASQWEVGGLFKGDPSSGKLGAASDADASREAILLPGDHLPQPASPLSSSRGTKTSTYQGSHFWSRVTGISWLRCNFGTFCVWSQFTMVVDWEVSEVFALSLWRQRPFK